MTSRRRIILLSTCLLGLLLPLPRANADDLAARSRPAKALLKEGDTSRTRATLGSGDSLPTGDGNSSPTMRKLPFTAK